MLLTLRAIHHHLLNFVCECSHQTMLLAIPFMREMPGYPSCRSSRTPCCPFLGMMTLLPHNTLSCTDSSSLRRLNGLISSSSPSLHPCRTMVQTLDSKGSLSVHCRICWAVTGDVCTVSIRRMISAGCGVDEGGSGRERRVSESALACFFLIDTSLCSHTHLK